MTEAQGPLAGVDDDAITRAFAADPMTLTDAELDLLVIELRRRRSAFLAAEAVKQMNKKPRAKPPDAIPVEEAAVLDKPISEITAEDIFGDD
jgi:hypothetical protein